MGSRRHQKGSSDWVLGTICLITAMTSGALFISMSTQPTQPLTRGDRAHGDVVRNLHTTIHRASNMPIHELLEEITVSKPSTTNHKFEMKNFDYKLYIAGINTICKPDTDIFIYIQSAANNFLKRRLLRRTWSSRTKVLNNNVRTVFILGRTDSSAEQMHINTENLLYGDIIQGNFTDSFRNMTKKALIAMSWIEHFCRKVKFVIKVDDDIFVDMLTVVENLLPEMATNNASIACHYIEAGKSPIERASSSRWYVPPDFFPGQTHFPSFCSGYLVVMTTEAILKLHSESKSKPVFQVDDAYMFGLLTQNLNLTFLDIKRNLTLSDVKGLAAYELGDRTLLGVGIGATETIEKLWAYTLGTELERVRPFY